MTTLDPREPVAWLRDAHKGTEDECLVPAAAGDPGAFPVYASPQPANPAQVTDAIRGIVEDALNSAIPEPWEVAEHATQRILAAIGAGGQVVGEEDALETIERELIDGLEVEISIGAENYTFNHRQLARRILSALSQPHPADERVVEAVVDKVLDAAGLYMGEQYGNTALHHPTDRARIKAALSAKEGRS